MNITDYLKNGKYILPDNPRLQYCGRIGRGNNGMPEMVFPCSFVKWRFKGTDAAVIIDAQRFYFDVYMGCFIDGVQYTLKLEPGMNRIGLMAEGSACSGDNMYPTRFDNGEIPEDDEYGRETDGELAFGNDVNIVGEHGFRKWENSGNDEHEIMLFKRQDACNIVEICGIELDKDAKLLECEPLPGLKMEVYGDSVSAGEVSEALERAGKPDPEGHEGRYSNSRYSYSWIAARKLNAQLHDIAQGGIPLLNGTGWFGPQEDLIGMESIYDKIRYYPDLKHAEKWDFSKFIPDVAVVAFGQNDAHPDDFMKTLRESGKTPGDVLATRTVTEPSENDKTAEKAGYWMNRYKAFLERLRELYPKALIVCTTTILCHDSAWDDAIDEVVRKTGDPRIKHFLYPDNGSGTPGHIRANEAAKMAEELAGFIRSCL